MRKLWLGSTLLLVCLCVRPVSAQWAVLDAPNLVQNTLSVANLLQIINLYTRDLQALASAGMVLQTARDLAGLYQELTALVAELESMNDGWAQLSTSGVGLCDVEALVAWKYQSQQWTLRSQGVVWQVQRVMNRGTRTIDAALQLMQSISALTGSTSGLQSTTAILGIVASEMHQMRTLTSAVQTALLGPDLIDSVLGVALVCVHRGHYAGWGTYSR